MEKLIKSKNGQWALLSGPQTVKEALSTLVKGNVVNFPVKQPVQAPEQTADVGSGGTTNVKPLQQRPEDARRDHNAKVMSEYGLKGGMNVPGDQGQNMNNLNDKLKGIDKNAPQLDTNADDENTEYKHHGLSPAHENMVKKYVLEGFQDSHKIHDHVKDIEVSPHEDGSHVISVLHNKVHPDQTDNKDWNENFLGQLQDNASLLGNVRAHNVTNFPGNRQLSRIKIDLRKPDSDKKTLTDKGMKYDDYFK